MLIELTQSNFNEKVLKSDKLVLVDFWASWCGPCRMIAPYVEDIAKEYDGRVVVGKVDVDSNPQIPTEYGIMNIPTLLFFRNGTVVDKIVGAVPKKVIVEKIEQLLKL